MGSRLVRDRALDNWVVPGAEHQVRKVTGREEHGRLLMQKLLEGVGELITSQNTSETCKELADVLSVLEGIAHLAGLDWEEVLLKVDERELSSGGFKEGLVWETSR